VITGEVPLREPEDTETVWFPVVLKVTTKLAVPPERDSGPGSTAFASLLDTCTVPVKLETRLFESSSARTVTLTPLPAVTEPEAADTESFVADIGGGVPLPVLPLPPSPPQLFSIVIASEAAKSVLRCRISPLDAARDFAPASFFLRQQPFRPWV
jgi:hypothetical protein